jgi:hypothetical protein
MDVQALRDFVRLQLDVDQEELPDELLNVYLQVAFDHTMAFNNRWPRYETNWALTKAIGSDSVAVPADLNLPSVLSVVSVTNPAVVLQIINHENAEQMFISSSIVATGTPAFISVWAGAFHLWPRYDTGSEYQFTVRGHRQPVWSNAASDIPDLDERLHSSMCWYAIALAYAQQEDEVLEGIYMARWERELAQVMKAILDPVRNHPLIMGGGSQLLGGSGWVINPPVT